MGELNPVGFIFKQGTMKLMQPLLDAGLIRRVGTRKSDRYVLA
jgi:hypothetical protein